MANIVRLLSVKSGTISLPGNVVPFWGFSKKFFGTPQIPGPLIESREGDNIRVMLFNSPVSGIIEPVSIIFPGQENVLVRHLPGGSLEPVQPQYSGGVMKSLTNYINPGDYGIEYRFQVTRPGVYLYESGTNPEKQVQMGLYGVILVWPNRYNVPAHPNYKTAYGAGTQSNYDIVKVIVLGEIDTVMHNNVNEGVYYNMLNFKPDVWVINGRPFPDTLSGDNTSTQPYGSSINCRVEQRVLLRIINAGFQNHTFHFGGLVGKIVAEDSYPLVTSAGDATYEKTGFTLGAGQSVDVIITPTTTGEYYLYDREYNHLVNIDQFPGGMMTRLNVNP